MDIEWFWIVVLTIIVVAHGFLDIFFIRWVLWRNTVLTKLVARYEIEESESLSSSDDNE
jgi:hypothetical protein